MKELRERLRYGTQLHNFVLDAVRRRKDFSLDKMRERHNQWRKNDEAFLAYMPEKDADAKRRVKREAGDPQFTTIYVPYDYAVLMSAHTYWTSVFLSRSPIFQYGAYSENPQSASIAIESVIDYQVNRGRILPPLYIWLLDVGKYGLGVVGTYWADEKVVVNREVEVPDTFMDVDLGTTHREMRRVAIPGYKGSRVYNVRPYDFLPDPRVTILNYQDGEFCGRLCDTGWNEITKRAAQGTYFNVDVLRAQYQAQNSSREWPSSQVTRPFGPGENLYLDKMDMGSTELLEMTIELIPRDWGLDESSFPEKWLFVVANDSVVIHAQPLGLIHNRFPFEILELEPDGYAMFKRSMLDIVKPMNDIMTWLVNTHFYNTRKSLNDMFVVDPSRVVMKDVLSPEPGKIIRLREEMYGQDVRTAITQFPTSNVTQAHMGDSQLVANMIQRVSGVNDSIMGMVQSGGRKTATEVRTSSSFGINRLKTNAEYFSATGFSGLSQLLLMQTQQLMDVALKVRIAGDSWKAPGAAQTLQVSPQDIQGQYDFIPVDGTLPIDRFAQVNMWTQLLQQMAQVPQVITQYDIGQIFGWVAQLGGLKNINNFKVQVMQPGQMPGSNVIPIGAQGGTGGKGRDAGSSRTTGAANVPAQVPFMGPSG